MRTAVYYSNRDLRLEEAPRPKAGPGELLVRVEASGICGSDVMEWYRKPKAPIVLGHEIAGPIEEVGDGVDGFAVGDVVATTHHVPCGTCAYCSTGRQSVCRTLKTTSFDPGGFAEYVRLPAINVELGTFKVPSGVSAEAASFVEPLACTIRAQRIAGVGPGKSVAVLGAGISGALQIQLARAWGGSRIFATDVTPYRLQMAEKLGADVAIDARDDVPARIREANGGRLADCVILCTGAVPAIEQALQSVDDGGSIMFFAPADPDVQHPLPLNELWRRCIQLNHSYAGPPKEMKEALALIADGTVDVCATVTHRLPLEQIGEGFDLVVRARESLKVIIEPHELG